MRLKNKTAYDVDELAEALEISRETVIREIHRGKISAVRVGKAFRIPQASVAEYLGPMYQEFIEEYQQRL